MNGFEPLEERTDDASFGIDLSDGPSPEIRLALTGNENRPVHRPVEIVGVISKRKFRALFDATITLEFELHYPLLAELGNEQPIATSVENDAIRHGHLSVRQMPPAAFRRPLHDIAGHFFAERRE